MLDDADPTNELCENLQNILCCERFAKYPPNDPKKQSQGQTANCYPGYKELPEEEQKKAEAAINEERKNSATNGEGKNAAPESPIKAKARTGTKHRVIQKGGKIPASAQPGELDWLRGVPLPKGESPAGVLLGS